MTTTLAPARTPAEEGVLKAFDGLDAEGARAQAMARFAELGLPHRRVEAWKWTDLRRAVADADISGAEPAFAFSRAPDAASVLERAPSDALPALAAAVSGGASVFELADGETLEIDVRAHAAGAHGVAAFILRGGVKARVIERYAGAAGFANAALLFRLGAGAELERVVRQQSAPEGVIVSTAGVELETRARLAQTTAAFGAKLARLETHVTIEDQAAEAILNGVTLLAGDAHADQTTRVVHAAPGAQTRETFRTVALDRASGVFQGKIQVDSAAQKTDARMAHDALLLSEGASINAKPELEIYADDVQCAHGNTIGALDAGMVFYLRQRGLTEHRAKALLTRAFIAEALEAISGEAARGELDAAIDAWLEARL